MLKLSNRSAMTKRKRFYKSAAITQEESKTTEMVCSLFIYLFIYLFLLSGQTTDIGNIIQM
jgi:hypothetical protein